MLLRTTDNKLSVLQGRRLRATIPFTAMNLGSLTLAVRQC